jgi:Fur family ferric uptake transcriptional regulator
MSATKSAPGEFQRIIRQRGYRVTPQRQLILDAVRAGKGHSTPDEVYRRVIRKAPALNRATVYRTLDFLAEQHLITCADLGTGSKVYEAVSEAQHQHLVCERCGKVEQISHRAIQRAFRQIERDQSFVVTTDHLALFGLCQECQKASVPEASATPSTAATGVMQK